MPPQDEHSKYGAIVSKRRANIPRTPPPKQTARYWLLRMTVVWTFVGAATFALTWNWHSRNPEATPSSAVKTPPKPFTQPTTLAELMKLSPAELDHCDIARMDLLCAQGLPGAENFNIPHMLATLDQWAAHVKAETNRNLHRFYENPKNFNSSEAYFRMEFFVTVMQEDYGVHYDPALMDPSVPDKVFCADSRNLFIHGLIGPERTGTCSSMPVLYVAVARRMGYPLYLATAKGHLLTQWDDGKERFNVEGTSWGFSDHSDEFYREWPEPISDEEMKQNRYLRPLSGAEELSIFLQNRGGMLAERFEDYEGALVCYERAHELTPTWLDVALTTRQLKLLVADPSALTTDPDEIARKNDEYRRKHGHYTPPLPAEAVAADPMLALPEHPTSEQIDQVNALYEQKEMRLPDLPNSSPKLPAAVTALSDLPPEALNDMPPEARAMLKLPNVSVSQQSAGFATRPLPNGTAIPMAPPNIADLKQSAVDHWPNPPAGLHLPWLNPRPIR